MTWHGDFRCPCPAPQTPTARVLTLPAVRHLIAYAFRLPPHRRATATSNVPLATADASGGAERSPPGKCSHPPITAAEADPCEDWQNHSPWAGSSLSSHAAITERASSQVAPEPS